MRICGLFKSSSKSKENNGKQHWIKPAVGPSNLFACLVQFQSSRPKPLKHGGWVTSISICEEEQTFDLDFS